MPLYDVTSATNIQRPSTKPTISTSFPSTATVSIQSLLSPVHSPASPSRVRHDPYAWHFVADRVHPMGDTNTTTDDENTAALDAESRGAPVCVAVVQHKCHTTECVSGFLLGCGQYVVIRGDRGIDLGVVVRVTTNLTQPLPSVNVLRYALQEEVDFWATNLKALEATALEYCRQRVVRQRLPMDVRHAEFQFDQKKLTFYYDARQRVDFAAAVKELHREFGCRIWMEKV